ALEGVVQGDLEAMVGQSLDQEGKVLHGAETRVDGGMASLGRADGPRTAGVADAGVEAVVPPLATGPANGMDGRQVEDVEAHGRHAGDPFGGGRQASFRAREQLVPGTD